MKTSFLKYLLIMLSASLVATSGCTSDSGSQPDDVSGMVTLAFDIDAMKVLTKGAASNPDNHPEEPGIEGENNIHTGGWLNVFIHDAVTNQQICHFDQDHSSPLTSMLIEKNEDGIWRVKVSTRALRRDHPYRISVMANANVNGGLYDETSASAVIFRNTSDAPDLLQQPHYMAFSGFKTFSVAPETENKSTLDIGTIWLLRAAARIDISLGNQMTGVWKIDRAVVVDGASTLYSVSYASPKVENVSKHASTEELTIAEMFNPFAKENEMTLDWRGGDVTMRDVNGDGTSMMIYMPEQDNPRIMGMAANKEIEIRLTMRHLLTDKTVDAILMLRNPESKMPYNLVRNHIYRYTVKAINPLLDVEFDVLEPKNKIIDVPSFN